MRPRAKKLLWIAPLAVLAMVLFVFAGGQLVKFLWNWLTPALFGFPPVTFWQALGILFLCRILFGGLGMGGGGRSRMRRRMEERWEKLTPEERERFREQMRGKWGESPDASAP